ncbi:hypothetical protein HPB48_011686 [Haemaphysalis longicornis]|uniref:Uncharacterized protein n=1 Tax=Haemaphysalis longicornis TaxID=44386 RepID=A0A9J6G9R7_HAELO|nr:hypothetical protein HPB48_011686 [Haemaphysalis longicornis]
MDDDFIIDLSGNLNTLRRSGKLKGWKMAEVCLILKPQGFTEHSEHIAFITHAKPAIATTTSNGRHSPYRQTQGKKINDTALINPKAP